MERKVAAVLFDLGDTLMIEETEVKDATGATLSAELFPGAAVTLKQLKDAGYLLALVADTRSETYRNVLKQHGLYDYFDAFAISDEIGSEKPSPEMFDKALSDLGLKWSDRHRTVMVGNNLARDVAGANRAGMISVWCRLNERYPSIPDHDDERPVYRIDRLEALVDVLAEAENALSRGPGVFDPDLALQCAPTIYFDQREPFLPDRVGCTVIDRPGPSPSFPRIFRPRPGERIIEYAIYWDWDIGHHYELEHVWVFLDPDDRITRVDASWHGKYNVIADGGGRPLDRAVALYSQPGKHAFAGSAEAFADKEAFTRPCRDRAGDAGLLVTPLFEGVIAKTPADDAWAARYLKERAFTPSFEFSRRFEITREMLTPWPELSREILERIDGWRSALSSESA